MSFRVDKLLGDVFEQSLRFLNCTRMGNNINHQQKKLNKKKIIAKYGYRKLQEKGIMGIAIPKLSQLHILRHKNATLVDSSTTTFGNECVRLVNIAFHTSQIFPSMMGTCASINQYLQKELIRRHSNKHFQIIIGENNAFSFAISDCGYFAEIEQEQYRILIFSTKQHKRVKFDTHDANNQMKLQWKSIIIL